MSLDVILRDGEGRPNSARINGEGELGVVVHSHPPLDEGITSYPFSAWFESSGSNDMRVDGSTTAQEFKIVAATNVDIFIKTISVRIADASAVLNKFGNLTALTNGVDWNYQNDALGRLTIQGGIQTNLDFIRLGFSTVGTGDGSSAFRADTSGAGADTYLPIIDLTQTFGFPWGLRLRKGTNDAMSFVVNDDLSTGMDGFDIRAFGIQI